VFGFRGEKAAFNDKSGGEQCIENHELAAAST
jgi:hypothetical protein